MKFSLFAHLERTNNKQSQAALYEDFIDLCTLADESGMHAIWTGEHHGMDFTIAPNPFINLVDLARRTKNVRLGTGTVVAPFWHPIKLAGEAAMTDVITYGRLDLGIARGAYNFEYERMVPGMNAWEAGQRMREIIPAIKGLWEGDYTHEGEFHQFPKTTCAPKPIQDGGPPIWVAARDPNSHEFAVAHHCNVQVTPLWLGVEEIESLMQRFNDACEKHQEVKRPKIMLLQHTYVASSQAEIDLAAKSISQFYCYFAAWFKNEKPINQALIEELTPEEMAAMPHLSPDKMLNNQVIGTSEHVIKRLKHYESLGYDEYAFWIDSGLSHQQKRESLLRFINEVMPAFQ